MTFERLPLELQQRPQWVCWRYEQPLGGKPTKVPYNPRTGTHASTTDPHTWSSFEDVTKHATNAELMYAGIGYVFAAFDPYCGIDLDDPGDDADTFARQQRIFEYLDSYSELSPSGKGLHVITKASVPHGRKRSLVEIYSAGRFFTMTGNVFKDAPIAERHAQVNEIWGEMGAGASVEYFHGDFIERQTDEAVYEAAAKAKNGDLFIRLWNGDWSGYPSNSDGTGSSEADFALIDILAFYTTNRIQLQRMFLLSAMGQRAKYAQANAYRQANLIGYMITKSFDRMLPTIDLSALLDKVNAALAVPSTVGAPAASAAVHTPTEVAPRRGPVADAAPAASSPKNAASPKFTYDGFDLTIWQREPPNGLMGMISKYVYDQAPRQVYEIALAASIGLMAGICGRAYNVSGTGLNHYLMLLASTGSGKEAMAQGIDKIIDQVKVTQRYAEHLIGPADIASGQALLKHLADVESPCFVSVTGEIGLRLQQMSANNANSSETALRRVLLDLYNKSGGTQSVKPTIYSDKKNNTKEIHSPAFSLLGESVPDEFYKAFDESSVSGGLLPRFIIIDYSGPRVPFNENAAYVPVPPYLVSALDNLILSISQRMQKGEIFNVGYDDAAQDRLRYITKYADDKINSVDTDILKQLWNRVHVKVLKLAALLAISDNPYAPTITKPNVDWAMSLIMTDVTNLVNKFNAGEIGQKNEATEQEDILRKAIKEYLMTEYHKIASYQVHPGLHAARIVTRTFVSLRTRAYAAFKHDKRGATVAINATLKNLIDNGVLSEVGTKQLREGFEFSGFSFTVNDMNWLLALK